MEVSGHYSSNSS